MENYAYNPQPESKSAYQKYVEQRNQWKSFQLNDEDKKRIQLQKQELSQIENDIKILENQPIMINQEEVNRKILSIDRLKTLKFLSHMHLNIKNGLTKNLIEGDEQEAFQEFIDGDDSLRNMHQKQKKVKQAQKDDILGKLDFNQQIMSKFIDQQQRIDMKFKNQETQYENPIQYQMIENQELLLAQQLDLEMQQQLTELQRKIDNQNVAKRQSNDEIQLMHKQIKNLKKENELLEKESEDNILLINMETNQKDSQQKAQYAMILQNKLNSIYSECSQDAHTYHIDLITILTQRASEQSLQIQKLEELLKDLCSRYNISMEIKKLDVDEIDEKINNIYSKAKQDQQAQVKQKTLKTKKRIQQKQIDQKQEVKQDYENIVQNIQTQLHQQDEELEEENYIEQELPKKKQKVLTLKQQQIRQSQVIIQQLQKDQGFATLSVQDQLNLILNNKDISSEVKKQMIQQFQNLNRSLLNKKDQTLLASLMQMNPEDFQTMTSTAVILPSRAEQIKKIQEISDKFNKEEEKAIRNNYPVQKSRYLDQNKATLLKQSKIMFKEEMNSYFLDWRLKEYLTLKGIKPKVRQIYIQMAKGFFTEMEMQLYEFEKNEMSKQLLNTSSQQENTTDTFDQTIGNESSANNTMQSKVIKKDLQTESNHSFKPSLNSKIKSCRNFQENIDDEYSWVTPQTRLTLHQQFQYELWLNKERRKNTVPKKNEYQEILNKIEEQIEKDDN